MGGHGQRRGRAGWPASAAASQRGRRRHQHHQLRPPGVCVSLPRPALDLDPCTPGVAAPCAHPGTCGAREAFMPPTPCARFIPTLRSSAVLVCNFIPLPLFRTAPALAAFTCNLQRTTRLVGAQLGEWAYVFSYLQSCRECTASASACRQAQPSIKWEGRPPAVSPTAGHACAA